ncbi:Putative 37S ribosomal protein S26A, mitochondrial [Leucoagaricus sp. SymC.cos]|nr:Putative 37S ribosomal protein S26A, mitochondrial [Leucoagaricus sp. SymC.cos]
MNSLGLRFTSASTRASVASSASCFKSCWGTRRLHQRRALPYPVEDGLGKFLPPDALKVQLEYQDGLLERLNEQVVGTAEASSTIVQTVINLSGKRDKVLAFNYASLALNNSFFLNNLKPPSEKYPNYEHEITDQLNITIRNAHGSTQQLRSAFSAAALGTFINGWVWFVVDQAGNTGIITTYGAGTLLVRSRSHMQKHPNFVDIAESAAGIHSTDASTMSRRNKSGSMLNAGEILYPLFCVPMYEHAWMSAGYGVWGKEQWLKELWSVVNWERVDAAYNAIWKAAQEKGPRSS